MPRSALLLLLLLASAGGSLHRRSHRPLRPSSSSHLILLRASRRLPCLPPRCLARDRCSSSRQLIYRCSARRSHPSLSCCVAPALSSFHPSPWKVKPPASPGPRLHLRPSLNLVRRTLNIISTRRSAPSRPKFSSLSHRNLCRSHPILAPATPYTPCPIQPAGAPIIATGAHDITSIPRFDSCCPPIRRVQHQLRLRTARVTDYRLLARHATNRKHGRKRCSGE